MYKIENDSEMKNLEGNINKTNKDITDLEIAKKMINIAKSAFDRELEFNLSFETVKKLLHRQNCFYTNIKFEEDGLYAKSFDRIDSSKGYTEDNVVVCTIDINRKKSNLSFEEIESIYFKISELKKKSEKKLKKQSEKKLKKKAEKKLKNDQPKNNIKMS